MKDRALRSSTLIDRVLSLVVMAVAIALVEYGWLRYPRPVEGGPLILGTAAALAAVRFYRTPLARPLLASTCVVVAVVLTVQVILQTAASLGWI